jgi:methylphosphotriester-DNA--protein-cysteine methyltransferase
MIARFDCRVGLTPKFTSRILRFRKSLAAIHGGSEPEWSGFAADHGYYDQAHLIHEFQEFASMTPSQYHKTAPSTRTTLPWISGNFLQYSPIAHASF